MVKIPVVNLLDKNMPKLARKEKKAVKVQKKTPKGSSAKIEKPKRPKKETVPKPQKGAPKKSAGRGRDTGSVDFQIKNFSEKIDVLSGHLKSHPHDFDSRRGLLIMVGKRRRLLNYVKKTDLAKYEKLVAGLKLRKSIDRAEPPVEEPEKETKE